MPLRTLSYVLWQVRHLLNMAAQGAEDSWTLHAVELDRAVLVHTVAETLDLDHDVPLRVLVTRLPSPWDGVFGSHHAALVAADRDVLPRSLAEFLR